MNSRLISLHCYVWFGPKAVSFSQYKCHCSRHDSIGQEVCPRAHKLFVVWLYPRTCTHPSPCRVVAMHYIILCCANTPHLPCLFGASEGLMPLITLPLPASLILLSPCVLYPGKFHMNNISFITQTHSMPWQKNAVANSKSVTSSVPSALGLQSVVA